MRSAKLAVLAVLLGAMASIRASACNPPPGPSEPYALESVTVGGVVLDDTSAWEREVFIQALHGGRIGVHSTAQEAVYAPE